jgi:hypothetical protein
VRLKGQPVLFFVRNLAPLASLPNLRARVEQPIMSDDSARQFL